MSWLAYAGAYLLRSNLSIILPEMVDSLHFTKTGAGLIGSAFFWAYAVGQLINGNIGDKVKSRIFIFLGLSLAAVINLLMGFSSTLSLMIILWGLNGFFLSSLWGPIIKTLSFWFSREQKTRTAVIISTSMMGGYLFTWGIIGQIISVFNWRWGFWLPSLIIFIYAVIWIFNFKNHPAEVDLESPNKLIRGNHDKIDKEPVSSTKTEAGKNEKSNLNFLNVIFRSRLWFIAAACLFLGIVKEGIILWGPTFLSEVYEISGKYISLFSLFIPVLSLGGILGTGYINDKLSIKDKTTIILLMIGAAFSFLFLYFLMEIHIIIGAFLLGLGVAFMYGANTLLLAVIPMNFVEENRVSGVAGFLDFSSYIGAALAGVLTGYIVEIWNWKILVFILVIISISGALNVFIARD
uniref:Major facilitator superfamily MFS-1 n=1 Tax=uncultured organism TaxID=155900 RepID=M1P1V0_9ZZZZ|nr:major facilitator superfamily MFS-1 [uncultured organism]